MEALHTEKLLHSKAFAHGGFTHTQKLLHSKAFAHGSFTHTRAFTHRSFYTAKLLHRKVFWHNSFCTQKLLTQKSAYTQKLLFMEVFCAQKLLHRESFYTHKLVDTKAFALSEKLLHGTCSSKTWEEHCTTKLAQSTSQYYFVLQSLHKVLPSTSYYKACTKDFPVLLRASFVVRSTGKYFVQAL